MYSHSRLIILSLLASLLLKLIPIMPSADCQLLAEDKKPPAEVTDFARIIEMARDLAKQPYKRAENPESAALSGLSYDDYRMLRFLPGHALWRGESLFEVQLFHPGFLFTSPVSLFQIVEGAPAEIPFRSEWFSIDKKIEHRIPKTEAYKYSGFKLTFPLHSALVNDDVIVFQGASYFRLVGSNNPFGISARGLAVDTAEPRGEEFPHFSRFWLVKPGEKEPAAVVYALLDSPSVTGAYSFTIRPGQASRVDCTATLFFRDSERKFGIAPLTSMFLRGENSRKTDNDFRPEVHDSDGLMILTGSGAQWLFRPLVNPSQRMQVSRFLDTNPRGFGLVQRDRSYENYLDLETHREDRPSIWIEPQGDWGSGAVELVEIASDRETNDNIVAYWVPSNVPKDNYTINYRLTAGSNIPKHDLATVIRTLIQPASLADEEKTTEDVESQRFVVDFAGPLISDLSSDQPVHAELSLVNGQFHETVVLKDDQSGSWRVTFLVTRKKNTSVDLRLTLNLRGEPLSETWLYLWGDTP